MIYLLLAVFLDETVFASRFPYAPKWSPARYGDAQFHPLWIAIAILLPDNLCFVVVTPVVPGAFCRVTDTVTSGFSPIALRVS